MNRIKKVCPECGSEDIAVDSVSHWDADLQRFELSGLFDTASCNTCEAQDIELEDVPLADDSAPAQAHHVFSMTVASPLTSGQVRTRLIATLDAGFEDAQRTLDEHGDFAPCVLQAAKDALAMTVHSLTPVDTVPSNDASSELDALRAFAQGIMQAWPVGGIDGGGLQDLALKHGLIAPATPTPDEMEEEGLTEDDPWYRPTSLLLPNS